MSARQIRRTLLRAAFSGAHVFAWIAAFHTIYVASGHLGSAFLGVALMYALQHVVTILLIPLAARNMRHGSIRTMEAAVLSAAAAFFVVGSGFVFESMALGISMGAFAFFLGVYRALYYVPYELAGQKETRVAFLEILVALIPAVAGMLFVSTWYMPEALFFAATGLILLSLVPIYRMRNVHEGFSWKYRETFHQLFSSEHHQLLMISLGEGIESVALLFAWPIAAWLIVGGSYPLLGVVLSATLLLTMVARLLLRSFKIIPTRPVAAAIHISGWVLRYFAGNAGAIMLIDVYSHAGTDPQKKGFDLTTYEHAADNHTYLDEYTALKEMGHALGRIIMCFAVVALALSNSFIAIFGGACAIAAIAGLAVMYYSRAHAREAF